MSDNFSKNIVQDTFENSFNKEKYVAFIKNLLNHIDDSEESKFVYQGQFIPQVYQESVSSLERIGKYTDPEGKTIDILIVNLKKEKSLERARTLQRNFVAWFLDGSRGGKLKDAALVAFVSPDSNSWRFSLVKMDYKIQEAKVKKDLTPAKRYSFLVGVDEKCHTAQSRLIPIIDDDKNNPTLKQIEEAFNIEKVTKEFFEKYRDLFIRLKESLDEVVKTNTKVRENFEKNNIDTSSFAKKLLGQLVFLYFLQKKGWFGVERDSLWGTGPKNFLRKLFNKELVSYKNFFNEVLEPLFYEALAKKRDKNFYSRLNCKIPFLNGGLFDPINEYDWVYTDINIDNEIFSNDFKTKEGDRGNGILDVFDRYNFTVREDEPLEKEVAVDPEMLGKVFENLLEVKDRKSKGTYYTPREIVHYMCQESLVNYLHSELDGQVPKEDLEVLVKKGVSFIHNDQSASMGIKKYEEKIPKTIRKFSGLIDIKLADIKVCDPAVGSGAFLVGMMTEIVNCREVLGYILDEVGERDIYKFKRWAIQHSLYGVDIDPSAVEVAKLRLWLSLVVEEDDIKKIKPLPNLDYKIMQGNSLLEEFKGVKLFDEKLLTKNKGEEHDFIAELKQKELELGGKLLPYYQKNPNWMKNRTISRPTELAEIEMEMDRVKSSLKKNNSKAKELIIKPLQVGLNFLGSIGREDVWLKLKKLYGVYFKSYDSDKKKKIRNSIEKVIWELIETTIRDEGKQDALKEIEVYKSNGIRPFFLWKLYFADVFQEKGGFDVTVANPPYVNVFELDKDKNFDKKHYKEKYMSASGAFDLYILFHEQCIKLVKNGGTAALISPNKFLSAEYAEKLREFIVTNSTFVNLVDLSNVKVFDASVYPVVSIYIKEKTNIPVQISTGVGDVGNIQINKTGLYPQNEVKNSPKLIWSFLISESSGIYRKLNNQSKIIDVCDVSASFSVSEAYKIVPLIKEIDNSDSKNSIKKLLISSNIHRYFDTWGNSSISYLKKRFRKPVVVLDPKILSGHRLKQISSEKIIIAGMTKELRATLDDKGKYVAGIPTVILTNFKTKGKYLLGLVNSKMYNYYFHQLFGSLSLAGGYLRIGVPQISTLPYKKVSPEEQKPFIVIVDKILTITKSDDYMENSEKQAKVRDYEKQIDQMVYKLYGLTKEEIEVVEEQVKN